MQDRTETSSAHACLQAEITAQLSRHSEVEQQLQMYRWTVVGSAACKFLLGGIEYAIKQHKRCAESVEASVATVARWSLLVVSVRIHRSLTGPLISEPFLPQACGQDCHSAPAPQPVSQAPFTHACGPVFCKCITHISLYRTTAIGHRKLLLFTNDSIHKRKGETTSYVILLQLVIIPALDVAGNQLSGAVLLDHQEMKSGP